MAAIHFLRKSRTAERAGRVSDPSEIAASGAFSRNWIVARLASFALLDGLRWPSGWRLRHLRIAARLRVVFICVMLLMFAGSSLSLWQFREIRRSVESASLVERRMTSVLQLDNSLLTLMNKLNRAADTKKSAYFESRADGLLADFRSETSTSTAALRLDLSKDTHREALILDSLRGVLDTLPSRIDSLIELARSDDWAALHARLANQVDHTDDVVYALVREIDADLSAARRRLLGDVERAQRRTARILAATGLASLAAAALLGLALTRSITRPLANLTRGAQALAQGHFGHQVTIAGSDEFAHMEAVFNRTASELEDLYAKIKRSEAHFRALIEKASDLILVVSRTGQLMYASPSSAQVLGSEPGKLIGQNIRDLVHTQDVPFADRIFAGGLAASGGMHSFELRFRRDDESFRILEGIASNFLSDPVVAGVVVNARDVSERRQAEMLLQEREDQLRQSQKMEAIGQLAGGVAHDFNNLLTVINGYSRLLLGLLIPGNQAHIYSKEILGAGERAADLTRQLLAFSRRQVLQPKVLDLNEVVRDTQKILRRVIGEDIELICNLDPGLGAVEADLNQIQQVLMNLSVNARDAMPDGGKLTIETSNVELHANSGKERLEAAVAPRVVIVFSDTGHGMDLATQQRIFEPFFTTKGPGKGTGLGLSIVYGILRQSNGSIAVESEMGKGTTFRIDLPRIERRTETVHALTPLPRTGGTETILLVEDQTEVRRFAAASLQSYGYHVIEASNGKEALQLHNTIEKPIHLVLTDIVMPGITGVELSRRLQLQNPGVKVLLVSGYADSVILRHGILDSGIALLQKPYSPAALALKIRELLDPPRNCSAV